MSLPINGSSSTDLISLLHDQTKSASLAQPKQGSPKSNIDFLIHGVNVHGLSNFFVPGGVERAVKAFDASNNIALMTGLNAMEGMPETNGPVGLAILGDALRKMGKTVTFISDSVNQPVIKAALKLINPEAAKYMQFVKFDHKDGENATKEANRILDDHQFDTVVAGELIGRSQKSDGTEGPRMNAKGENINAFNAATDELLKVANQRDNITTIAFGDRGNEAGMGGLEGLPKAQNGKDMATAIPANIQVTSWNTNLGLEAAAAVMLANAGKKDEIVTPMQVGEMIKESMQYGAVDGVTGGGIPDIQSKGKHGEFLQSGVNGHGLGVHKAMTTLLRSTVDHISAPKNAIIAKKIPEEGPFIISVFDSSNGGLIAAQNLQKFLEYRFGLKVRFIVVTDHGNAPYGPKSRTTLIGLVNAGMRVPDKLALDENTPAADGNAFGCNTADTATPEALQPNDELGTEKVETKIFHLIQPTANAMVELGGDRPVGVSTAATAKDNRYHNLVQTLSGEKETDLIRIGAPGWADAINMLAHLDAGGDKDGPGPKSCDWTDWSPHLPVGKTRHEEMTLNEKLEVLLKKIFTEENGGVLPSNLSKMTVGEKLQALVNLYVDRIPKNATSVWLTCTHYPAVKELMEKRLQETGRGHIEVIDPMEFLAMDIGKHLREVGPSIDRSKRLPDLTPIVITSGKPNSGVSESAQALLHPKAHVVHVSSLRDIKPKRVSLIHDLLFKPEFVPKITDLAMSDASSSIAPVPIPRTTSKTAIFKAENWEGWKKNPIGRRLAALTGNGKTVASSSETATAPGTAPTRSATQ